MPVRSRLQEIARRLFHERPRAEAVVLRSLDVLYRIALLPYRRPAVGGTPHEDHGIVARTDEYNAAAERYFRDFEDPQFLVDKPYSDLHELPKHLFDVAMLLRAMRLQPGDTVAEIGAGTCWLSHMLNRAGCRTISIDVSPTALAMGRRLFENSASTRWDLDPRLLTYDGHRLPLEAAECDAIVMSDAFHHVPNQRGLLREMHRVLKAGGVVAMSEPGRGHRSAAHSLEEASAGVLENELVLEDLAALAGSCGFSAANVIVATPHVAPELAARDLGAFMGGKGFARYWKELCQALEQHHYLVLHKGPSRPTTARPSRLVARIDAPGGAETPRGASAGVTLRITNAGDTWWLGGNSARAGWTRLGAHLYRGDTTRELLDFNWFRADLPTDLGPQEHVSLHVALPPIDEPGAYSVMFDLVVEGAVWFADRESSPSVLRLRVI